VSELNYEILGKNDRKSVVHINRLKLAHGEIDRDSNPRPQYMRRMRKREQSVSSHGGDQSETVNIGARSFAKQISRKDETPPRRKDSPGRSHVLDSPSPLRPGTDTPAAKRADPTYQPGDSPQSRRELQDTRNEPPLTRSRARSIQDKQASLE